MSVSVPQSFKRDFDPDSLTTHSFTIVAPPELPREKPSAIKVYLVAGAWDDCGNLGDFNCPCNQGQVCRKEGGILIAKGVTSVNGTVKNLIAGGCGVAFTLEWVYESDDCPPGHIKCRTNRHPGYCCTPCDALTNRMRGR